jgi:hypothetical protein
MSGTMYGINGVIASRSAVLAVATGVEVGVTFDVEAVDTSGVTETAMHSTTVNADRFYAPENGFYLLLANVKFASINAAGRVYLGYKIDGGATVVSSEQVTSGTASSPGLVLGKYLLLNKGQYVTLRVAQTAIASVNIVVEGTEIVFKRA